MKRLRLWGAAVGLCLLFATAPVFAVSSNLSIDVDIDFNDELFAELDYRVKGTNKTNIKEVSFPLFGRQIEELKIDVNGDKVTSSTKVVEPTNSYEPVFTELTFSLPSSRQAAGAEWELNVSYQTDDLSYDALQLQSLTIPPVSYDADKVGEKINISLPLSAGLPIAFGEQPSDSLVEKDRQTYGFEFDKQRTTAVILQIGTQSTYQLDQTYTLKNDGWWWKTFTITAPPDTNQQVSFLESLSPQPSQIRIDQDGNVLLDYSIGPKKTAEIKVSSEVTVRSLNYNINSNRPVTDVPQNLSKYTEKIEPWSGGQPIDGQTASQIIQAIYEKYNTKLNEGEKFDTNQAIADARASGLPARFVEGYVVHSAAQKQQSLTERQWMEIYLPGGGWLTIDPLSAQYSGFGLSDAFHIATFVDGLGTKISESELIAISQELESPTPTDELKPVIKQTKFVLLPGVSIKQTKVIMSAGIVVDGLAYAENEHNFKLGSLAPLQKVSNLAFSFGVDSWQSNQVSVGILDGDTINALNVTTTNINWLPSLVTVLIAAGVVGLFVLIHKHRHKSIVMNTSDEEDGLEAEELLKN